MAITTYAELQTALGNWLTRSDLTARLPEFIVLFEAWANRTLRVRQMETSATITMASGAGTLPADYLQWREVRWPGSNARSLEYADRAWLTETYPNSPSSSPAYFTIEGSTISVMPVDNTSLTLRYYQKIPALSAGNQATHWLFNAHTDLYLAGPLHEAYALIKDAEKALLWMQKRDLIKDEIVRLSQKGKSPGEIRLQGVYTP
jgi:hypothetical protein